MTNTPTLPHRIIAVCLITATLLAAASFYQVITSGLYDFSQPTIVDIDIYWKAAVRFLETGQLYERFNNLQQGYAPSEPVYKFPPAYQLTLLPFINTSSDRDSIFLIQRLAQIAAYLIGCLVLIGFLFKDYFLTGVRTAENTLSIQKISFICLSLIIVFSSRIFPDTFQNTTPECFIFLLLAIAFWQIKQRPLIGGIALAIASAFKIYPVFFLLYPVISRNYRMLVGFTAGFGIATIASLLLVGYNEHLLYLQEILPILLAEKPLPNSQNLTLESLAINMHLLENMNGTSSMIIKWFTLAALVVIGLRTNFHHQKQSSIYFGLLCCGVLMFLSNYWLQYQLILLIPMFYLLGETIRTKNVLLALVTVCCFMLFTIDREWSNLIIATMDQIPTEQEILAFVDANPSIDPLWHFAPSIWVIYFFAELKPLLPVLLFLGLFILHTHKESADHAE